MASIDLDWANEDCHPNAEGAAKRTASTFNLKAELAAEDGGGGWPVYRFTGRREDIVALLGNYEPDDAARAELIDTIAE